MADQLLQVAGAARGLQLPSAGFVGAGRQAAGCGGVGGGGGVSAVHERCVLAHRRVQPPRAVAASSNHVTRVTLGHSWFVGQWASPPPPHPPTCPPPHPPQRVRGHRRRPGQPPQRQRPAGSRSPAAPALAEPAALTAAAARVGGPRRAAVGVQGPETQAGAAVAPGQHGNAAGSGAGVVAVHAAGQSQLQCQHRERGVAPVAAVLRQRGQRVRQRILPHREQVGAGRQLWAPGHTRSLGAGCGWWGRCGGGGRG